MKTTIFLLRYVLQKNFNHVKNIVVLKDSGTFPVESIFLKSAIVAIGDEMTKIDGG